MNNKKSALAGRQEDDLATLDAAARARALDLASSFIVQAPAGAGKTELLTQRILGLLARVEAPEQIVAITFTRKAAAEMRERILKRLAEAADAMPASPPHAQVSWRLAHAARARDAALGWGLLEQPERLRLTTIDALCASLVRQMPYLSRFGGMPRIADQPQRHYEEAARRTVGAVESAPAVAQALALLDNDAVQLRRLLTAMLAFREQWWPYVHGLRPGDATDRAQLGRVLTGNLERLVGRELAAAAPLFAAVLTDDVRAAARYVAATKSTYAALLDWHAPLDDAPDSLQCWQALSALLLTTAGTPRKRFDAKTGLAAGDGAATSHRAALLACTAWLETDPAAQVALRSLGRCPLPQYAAADLVAIETFAEVLVLAAANLWAVFQENGETDFAAIAERALQALGSDDAPTDLALRLDYGIQHLLVDEFQDTNPQQIALLEKLTAGWLPDDGRTLFVVGDPMQSIYRFRKADVGLFLRARDRGIGALRLEALTLYRNNRSTPAIVDWVNSAFSQVFPAVADAERGRVCYAPSVATRAADANDTGGVTLHPILIPRDWVDGEALGAQGEARAMLDIIAATRRERPAADIAVLVRARDHLAPLVDTLRRYAPTLAYEAVEIESLAERQSIQDLLALTRALWQRADRVHWLAVLRAPWCGLTLADLHALAAPPAEGQTRRLPALPTVWSLMNDLGRCARLSADGQARLAHARAALAPLLAAPGRLPLRRTVETAWRRLGGAQCLATATEPVDVAAYFRLLDDLEAGGRFDPDRLAGDVARLFAAPSSDPAAGRLKFMTIHKSKGLEFDTVILPGLHRRGGRNETRLLTWDSATDEAGQPRLVVAPIRSSPVDEDMPDGETDDDALRRYIAALESERADQETRRLLYVAATRARRSLHLLAVARPQREATTGRFALDAPKQTTGTPFNILWPVLAPTFNAALAQLDGADDTAATATTAASASAQFAAFVPRLQRLPLTALPLPVADSGANSDENSDENREGLPVRSDAPGVAPASALAPAIGTLVHRYLELIAQEGLAQWDAARVARCRPAAALWLRQQGLADAQIDGAAARVIRLVTQTLASARGRWLLQARPGAVSEWRLTQQTGAAWRNHVIDRSFVEEGVRWIIDYKTGAAEDGELDAFIAAKRAEYAPQLERYAALFPDETVRQALYFVDADRFEILD